MPECLLDTGFIPYPLKSRGKVRDIFDLGEHLLLVATDRVSAFDVVLPTGVPGKGRVLTKLSEFWFRRMDATVPNHMVSTRVDEFPSDLHPFEDRLTGWAMLVRKAEVIPVECVVRGYLAGSGWKEYQESRTVCGIELPEGLVSSDRLPEPIFTPAAKNQTGHDENISFERMAQLIGSDLAETLRGLSLRLYKEAASYALEKGIILADTKLEFGLIDGDVVLIDEVFTPDSSRFWPADQYRPGQTQESLDKQHIRDYLETTGWNKKPPAPELPSGIVEKTRERYLEAYRQLTGSDLEADL